MSFINNLNDTYDLLNKLDDVIINEADNRLVKKHLLSVTDSLAKYKDIDVKNIDPDNNKIKSKIIDVLNRISEIEINVKNKLTITEKYNSYLNS